MILPKVISYDFRGLLMVTKVCNEATDAGCIHMHRPTPAESIEVDRTIFTSIA